MSMQDAIRGRVEGGEIVEIAPTFPGDPHHRSLYVSPEIWTLANGPWESEKTSRKCARLIADLSAFVAGDQISVCNRPFQAKDAFLGLLSPVSEGVWDIRLRDPDPGIRLIGKFALKDVFIALLPASRSVSVSWVGRGPLGSADSMEWAKIIRECKADFRRLFGVWPSLTGDTISDHLSANFISV